MENPLDRVPPKRDASASRYNPITLLLTFPLFVVLASGCDLVRSNADGIKRPVSRSVTSSRMRYDGGFVFAGNDHTVGIDVSDWGLSTDSEVERIDSSCDCVQASLLHLDDGPRKRLLVVRVIADSSLSQNVPLAVVIEAVLRDDSKKQLSFEFTHVGTTHL